MKSGPRDQPLVNATIFFRYELFISFSSFHSGYVHILIDLKNAVFWILRMWQNYRERFLTTLQGHAQQKSIASGQKKEADEISMFSSASLAGDDVMWKTSYDWNFLWITFLKFCSLVWEFITGDVSGYNWPLIPSFNGLILEAKSYCNWTKLKFLVLI